MSIFSDDDDDDDDETNINSSAVPLIFPLHSLGQLTSHH